MNKTFTLIALIFNLWLYAQPGSLDLTFDPGTGTNRWAVNATALQSDGKIIIGGDFTSYNGTAQNCITRLNTDGNLDTSFNTGTGAYLTVRCIALQSDGKILIGGGFSSYNGTARNCIARLNTNGSLDTTFKSILSGGHEVNTIAIQSDGKIIIGGSFHGTGTNRIARLNIDGSLDTTFISGSGVDGYVYATAIQSDGKIIIGGNFNDYNGTAQYSIARLNTDGTLDATFNPADTGANISIGSIVIQSDGKIFIGGYLTAYNGTARNHIVRLNTDGSVDASFNPTGTGADNRVFSIAIQSDGKILIGGYLTAYNGTARNRIARLNADGSLDASFNPTGTGADLVVYSISIQSDGKVIIGGGFTSYNDTARNRIARLNADGTTDINTLSSLENNISIYPNPAKNLITVKLNSGTVQEFTIANQLGQSVLSGILTEVNNTVDITTLTAGMYFLKSGEHNSCAMKLIKE